ncbi:MAG: hypothetical protein ABI142_08160 [Bryocella sp.]
MKTEVLQDNPTGGETKSSFVPILYRELKGACHMRTIVQGLLLGCLVLGSASASHAQAQPNARTGVSVVCSCDDVTGKLYAEALHNALTKNQHYREVGKAEGIDDGTIRISIISLPISDGTDGQPPRAALSIVCLHNGAIIHQFVETCTHISITACAQSMLSDLLEWESSSKA